MARALSLGGVRFRAKQDIFLKVLEPFVVIFGFLVEPKLLVLLRPLGLHADNFLSLLCHLLLLKLCKPILEKVVSCGNLLDVELPLKVASCLFVSFDVPLLIVARCHRIVRGSLVGRVFSFVDADPGRSYLPKHHTFDIFSPFGCVLVLSGIVCYAVLAFTEVFGKRVFVLTKV